MYVEVGVLVMVFCVRCGEGKLRVVVARVS
jgi:hypothetical protein